MMVSIDLPQNPSSVPAEPTADAHTDAAADAVKRVKAAHRSRRRGPRILVIGAVGVLAAVPVVLVLAMILLVLIVLPLRCEGLGENRPASRSKVIGVDRRNGRIRWSFETEGAGELAASNVSHGWLAVRSRDGDLIMLTARTGARRWDVQLNDVAASRPVIDGQTIMVLTKDRVLRAYDVRTGRPQWQFAHAVGGHRARRRGPDLPSDFDVRDSFGIAAARGVVVALGRGDRTVHAYHVRTGGRQWTAELGQPAGGIPVTADDLVLVQDQRVLLHALDLRNGTLRWTHDGGADAVGRCQRLLQRLIDRVNRTTSTSVGTSPPRPDIGDFCATNGRSIGESTDLPPSIVGGGVVVDFEPVGGVSVLDRATGALRWRAGFRSVAVAPRAGALVGSAGSTSRRDELDGTKSWQLPYRSELLVSGDEVIVATRGHLRGVDLATGATRWVRKFGGPQATPLATTGDLVVISQ